MQFCGIIASFNILYMLHNSKGATNKHKLTPVKRRVVMIALVYRPHTYVTTPQTPSGRKSYGGWHGVIDIEHSKIYLSPEDYEIVKEEEPYVQKRYFIIALMLQEKPFGISRAEGAKHLHLSKRHVYRLIKRFREEGIPGLRHRSTRPKTIPNISLILFLEFYNYSFLIHADH